MYPQVPAQTTAEKATAGGTVFLVAAPLAALVSPEAASGGVAGAIKGMAAADVRQTGAEVVSNLAKGCGQG